MNKILVIGLDGATWELIKPWAEEGILPAFAKLMNNGCHGKLESCIPPVTFPAWKCYSAGKNPGKLGVYWWMYPDFVKQDMMPNISSSFKSKEIWDYLNDYGINSGVIGMPTTFPVKKLNGFMISEFCPGDSDFAYPEYLEIDLKEKFNYSFDFIDFHGQDKDEVIKDRLNLIKQRFEATKYLMKKFQPAFLHLTIFQIDNIQHFYWKYMDENDKKYGNAIQLAWKLIDKEIAILLEEYKMEHVFLMSDHGFVCVKGMFNIDQWLLKKNYLSLNKKTLRILNRLGLTVPIGSIGRRILSFIKLTRSDLLCGLPIKFINWKRTRVVALGQGILYLNDATFSSEKEKIEFVDKLIKEIKNIKNPVTGENLAKEVYRKEELYKGKYLDRAPDVIILPDEGYEIINGGLTNNMWNFSQVEDGWSATHKLHGIFLAGGSGIKKNHEIKDAKIYDLAPTILHIFGLPIPDDMDGRVLTEIFEEDSELAKRKPIYVDPGYYEIVQKNC